MKSPIRRSIILAALFCLMGFTHLEATTKATPPSTKTASPLPILNHGCYLDLGVLSAQMWGLMEWYPEQKLNKVRFDQYLGSLFTQLKYSGVRKIYLSFAQIATIDKLLNEGAGADPSDAIARMMLDFPGSLKELIRIARLNGMKIDLSFGGESAVDMKICAPGQTPEGQAAKIALFLDRYGLDGVDFDIENTLLNSTNSPETIEVFFRSLFTTLSAQGKTSTLTIMGSIYDWPKNFLKFLFYDTSGNLIIAEHFHRINLMLYSATQYYLDADHATWGLQQWLDLLGPQNAGFLSIGFEDGINYADPNSSAGNPYTLSGRDSGTAAAEIYGQILATLQSRGYSTNFAPPFFWPDNNRHDAGTWSRYQIVTAPNGKAAVKFAPQVMKAFYLKLAKS